MMRCFVSLAMLVSLSAPLRAEEEPNRSPVDVALSPDGSWLVSANQTSDSVSLVSLESGEVVDEQATGRRPAFVVVHPDGRRVFVSCSHTGTVEVFNVAGQTLKRAGKISTGGQPHGIAVSHDGQRIYVALGAVNQVAVVDVQAQSVSKRIEVGRWPRYLALSPDGSRLAIGTSGDRSVSLVDTKTLEYLHQSRIGLNLGHMQVSRDGQVYFPWIIYRRNPINASNIRAGWVLASRVARLRLDKRTRRESVSLDPRGKAVADPHGLAISPDEKHLVIAASGTHELLVFDKDGMPFRDFGDPDHIDGGLLNDRKRFSRVDLGGRPMGVRIGPDNRTAYVANYLDNSVQMVDLESRKLVDRVFLGGPATLSLARRGEAIFHDGQRSLDQWYSCHSCHYDGGTNAVAMDTHNDGSTHSFKTVLPLYNVHSTSPWTWHGWQQDLSAAMRKSITTTMIGPEPSDDDVQALLAYLKSLTSPPNPYRSVSADEPANESVVRGRQIFHSTSAACATCHSGPAFTDGEVHDVGLTRETDAYKGYNTPSLVGVAGKVRWLHDGRATSLESVLSGSHSPVKATGGRELTDAEIADLVAFLRTL